KRNPMRSERICSLARFLIVLSQNPAHTAAQQWLERTLDDSANRRLSITEGFLAVDAVLDLSLHVTRGLEVRAHVVASHAGEQLPRCGPEAPPRDARAGGAHGKSCHTTLSRLATEAQGRVRGGG